MDYGPRTRAELEALQLERLQWSVAHAYRNVASFRAKCEQRGVSPADIRSLADIALLPFTTKADLRAAYPFGMFAVPQEQVSRVHASSGTTGRPTVVGYTANDIKTWSSLIARCIHAAGGRPGMKAHIAYGYGLFTGGLGAHYGAEALGCTVIPMSGGQTEKQVQLIEDFKPEIIMVTPSYMLCILDEYRKQGLDPRATSLRYGIFGAEPWTEAMRREIEEAFDIRASDIYGLSEVMGPGVAQEIAGTSGPTIWEDHFLPEIVDPETGEVLPDGEEGELVFTSLTKEALPIIRYRTRDLTRLLPGEGLPYRRIAKIVGRSDDMLIIRGVNVFPTQIEEQVLKCPGLAPHFLIEISRPSRMDEVLIEVEPRGDLDHEASAAQCRLLASYVKDVIGVTARINLRRIGDIPRSTGKASHVRDLRLQALSA
ncbi:MULTISPECIES: AMP-binding protein [Sphingomonadaceae]|jgi:phenylacetate-CoA ligase|uniref:AMP-binding protein n=1 Tax=Sphingomonadales TaxID=204457 RepID=UPI000871E486|nr:MULTISPECIES: AMP-binding protein [Sphingomonadaceae]OJY53642.1 MAG: phenylacetate--CoA ligase [Sphingomonas sp. 67-41]HCW60080.1 phenylacetate--CoA ligase [Sphingobium sp.]MBN8812683.1 AMP-binding protein [Sphingomonas sp.]RQW44568.1 phenylacetate--CoA ligase [Novosphingobium sp. LASN5T]VVT18559.1 phenylacetyl-CoA ligase [Sphingomonas sp. EC-HK361]|tara:strand:- start:2594 stop:3874 length:1281 start_codon:yes stop_codon:yes gene_type:complete